MAFDWVRDMSISNPDAGIIYEHTGIHSARHDVADKNRGFLAAVCHRFS
jgi:hypothetical protein